MQSPVIIRDKVPRHIRRLMDAPAPSSYQREEYRTSTERNARYNDLRVRGISGLVRYSDASAIGLVYCVAWPMAGGMAGANRNDTGGRVPYTPTCNLPKSEPTAISMETRKAEQGKLKKLEAETVSMETGDIVSGCEQVAAREKMPTLVKASEMETSKYNA